ncbi:MAG: hypothetical protein V4463_07160 [Pseudomonadota bacterium]
MNEKLPPALRQDGQLVTVIETDDTRRPVLGSSRPDEADKRARVLRHWDPALASPRAQRLATIDEPLPQRSQTILSHEVDPALRQRLNGGHGELAGPRAAAVPATRRRKGLA